MFSLSPILDFQFSFFQTILITVFSVPARKKKNVCVYAFLSRKRDYLRKIPHLMPIFSLLELSIILNSFLSFYTLYLLLYIILKFLFFLL